MATPTLGSSVIKSLRIGQMHPDLPLALLHPQRNKVRHRTEDRFWDYKEQLPLTDPYQIAEFAKDMIAFHNTDGGLIVVGVNNEYAANGVPTSMILDKKQIRDKLRRYCGDSIDLFQDSIELPNERLLWLIFVRKYADVPQGMEADGPYSHGRHMFNKGNFFYRDGDEVKRCRNDNDIERVFRGFSSEHLSAYNYEVDEPYFRLLDPNCEKFIGRRETIEEVKDALNLRNPIVALDGIGGVGKTAIAIQAVKELYAEKSKYLFIASTSAKSRVWQGYVRPRVAAFAGLHGLLSEFADVIPDVAKTDDTVELKRSLITFMKDMNGLLVIDNLEEINDPGVMKFLSDEVPAPVKVLITSRIDKSLGARTISVPAMTNGEARDLLDSELERHCYEMRADDAEHRQIVLEAAGGVPLAIKWASQIASERDSLKIASSILRGAGSGRDEFLSFCFATMYDSLSGHAKDVARLIPYLDAEWRPMTLAVALDVTIETIRTAIHELSDRGIIYRASDVRSDDYGVLPLTKEFLSNKWHESVAFRKVVTRRLDEIFSSDGSEGFLLEWPRERRLKHLATLARGAASKRDYLASLKLAQLAQSWLGERDLSAFEPTLRFLEGVSLYMLERRGAGIAHMRQALKLEHAEQVLQGDDLLTFAQSLFAHGGQSAEKEACQLVYSGIQRGGIVDGSLWEAFLDCSLKRNDLKPVATIVSGLHDMKLLSIAFDRLGRLLVGTIGYQFAQEWSIALDRLLGIAALDGGRREYYLDLISQNRQLTRVKRS